MVTKEEMRASVNNSITTLEKEYPNMYSPRSIAYKVNDLLNSLKCKLAGETDECPDDLRCAIIAIDALADLVVVASRY